MATQHGRTGSFLLTLALALAGCSMPPKTGDGSGDTAMDRRVDELERRVQRLEGRPAVEAPYRGRDEIEAQIEGLRAQRDKLLVKYTPEHPAVKDIDRKLLILNGQLGMLKE